MFAFKLRRKAGRYYASAVEFPGIEAVESDRQKAIEAMREALFGVVNGYLLRGLPLPTPIEHYPSWHEMEVNHDQALKLVFYRQMHLLHLTKKTLIDRLQPLTPYNARRIRQDLFDLRKPLRIDDMVAVARLLGLKVTVELTDSPSDAKVAAFDQIIETSGLATA